jgi:hypothetical protein
MKKLIENHLVLMIILVFVMTVTAFAIPRDDARNTRTDILQQVENNALLGTGETYYVDSGATGSATGADWANAVLTLDAGVNLCTDSRGDIIYVAQGHNEGLSAADDVDVDVIGVTIIGIGRGSLKPTFDYDESAGEFVIGADNVTIANLRFRTSSSTVTKAIDIENGVDYAHIIDCEFGFAETATDEFTDAIIMVNNNTGTTIEGCLFDSGLQDAVSAIVMDADTDLTTIRNNVIMGDYSTACIENDTTASTKMLIEDNLLMNGLTNDIGTEPVIDILTGCTGIVRNNDIMCNLATVAVSMETANTVVLYNNFYNEDVGAAASGIPWHVGSFGGTLVNSVSASGDG